VSAPHETARGNLLWKNLFAKAWFHRDPLAPFGAAAGKNFLAALGLHARAKAVLLRSLAPIGLECTFGHEKLAAPDEIDGIKANSEYK
jgi:hypothetical protein